ncbi:MAG: bifunctional demethylmenaquinone methyltransferase/2-methoxy-6-polyprenyl-1,4-benzoquinol methylase UbiE [Flavobacteriales bacterium]
MTVTPYKDTEKSKKQQVADMFDNISPSYDKLNRSLSFGIDVLWRKKIKRILKKKRPASILDVATGTADVALELSALKPEKITGVDISEGMLAVGREKIKRRNLQEKIVLLKGDSEDLQFPDNSFDAITVAFGVRNFENLEKGLAEMQRVLKPGGTILILEFSQPKIFPIKQLYHFYFSRFIPWWGKIISKDQSAYQYLFDSVQTFPYGEALKKIMKSIGYKDITFEPVTFGIVTLYKGSK